MGEAKLHAQKRMQFAPYCVPMNRHRFNLYAIGARSSRLYFMFEELSWWSSPDERIIAVVGRDSIDGDYSWSLLVRDAIGRFRAVNVNVSYKSLSRAEEALWQAMTDTQRTEDLIKIGRQGDEPNSPTDLLQLPTDADKSRLHPYFRVLFEEPAYAPARAVIREIGPWLTPQDPHLVEEFQHQAFDQRLWEIYLWAALREFGFDVQQLEAPDFLCRSPIAQFTVEATTAAPSTMGPLAEHPNPQTTEEMDDFLLHYMPIKYGSSLTSKLRKQNSQGKYYWERDASIGKPFLIAIADFHKSASSNELGSMTYTQSALWRYLYGQRVNWSIDDDGNIHFSSEKLDFHKYGEKVVPSGFFDDPLATNVSAVLFSNAGTLAKFNRIGVVAGFGVPAISYLRVGFKSNDDPEAIMGIPFVAEVTSQNYEEYWSDEIQVFHNPNAKHPLSFEALPGATHHYFRDGMLRSFAPRGTILSSHSIILLPKNGGSANGD